MNIQQALVAAYNSRDDVAFDRLTEQVMKRVTDLEKECQAVGKQIDQYDEFGCVYDPEGPLPTLAEKVHGTIVELQDKASLLTGVAAAKQHVDRLWESTTLTDWQTTVVAKIREALATIPPQTTPAKQQSVQEK